MAAEFAAVSARRSRIRQLAEEWISSRRSWLLPVLEKPATLERYIAACQIGITVSGLVLGACAEATIANALTPLLVRTGLQASTAEVHVGGGRAPPSDGRVGHLRGAGAQGTRAPVQATQAALLCGAADGAVDVGMQVSGHSSPG